MTVEASYKGYTIIFAGTAGTGKTTAISSLSDNKVITIKEVSHDAVTFIPKNTIANMDYGVIHASAKEKIHLYGVPDKQRLDFIWEELLSSALGFVLLISAKSTSPIRDLMHYIQYFRPLIQNTSMVVGITHSENMSWDLHQVLTDELIKQGIPANVVVIDPRNKSHMANIVSMLVYAVS